MERYIVAVIGGIIAVAALVYVLKLLALKLGGEVVEAEVIAVTEPKQGVYVHKLRYEIDGKSIESEDKTGYSQPFSRGDVKTIVCSRRDPKVFEYEPQLKKNMLVAGILVFMSVLIVLRFLFFVRDGELEEDITLAFRAVTLTN